MPKPKVGIFSLTCCEGCQLEILNCEDELLDIAGAVDIVSFGMAQSNNPETALDIAFVEGTVVMESEVEILKAIRERSTTLIAIGACATYGGVAAMNYEVNRKELKEVVYGADAALIPSITPSPLHKFVKVDFSLQGCPIEKSQFLKLLGYLLHGDSPIFPDYPVCAECKRKENECVLVQHNIPCMGPITVAGCDARCPSHFNGCDGCFGPVDEANVAMEYHVMREKGMDNDEIRRMMHVFAPTAEVFKKDE
ncbi:MAG: NADH:ubiquinone oxidoreductase [Proteobacteria bacterium]|nr:NADH:ubiquinone oxidoreductase [Pseudomonadota bacterium]